MNKKRKKILEPDFCVIGAGSGGLSFAAGAVQMGAEVVLLEGKKMGGDCLNYGCVPSKSLISIAKNIHNAKNINNFGYSTDNIGKLDYKKVHKNIHSVIDSIAPHDSIERFTKLGVKVISEEGFFLDSDTVESSSYIIKSKCFIVATGSYPFIPEISGLDSVDYYTNENIFNLKTLPEHLIVIGGGPIGMEMAQSFNRFGSKVTVLESAIALPKDDRDITDILKGIIKKEGVSINEKVKIIDIRNKDKELEINCRVNNRKKTITASHILVATGRRPNIEKLNLDKAKVKFSPRGIEVDAYLRTTNKKIYAIGDCIGGYQFTHVAGYHASLAIKNSIFRLRSKVFVQAIAWVTYTDPELAHVGYLESQLQDKYIKYKAINIDFDQNDRAQTEQKTKGKIKLLVSPRGNILGVTILGNSAGELIYPWVIAIQNKLKISAIANSIAPYPTLNDISKRAASSYYSDKIFSPFMKKIVKFIMKYTW